MMSKGTTNNNQAAAEPSPETTFHGVTSGNCVIVPYLLVVLLFEWVYGRDTPYEVAAGNCVNISFHHPVPLSSH